MTTIHKHLKTLIVSGLMLLALAVPVLAGGVSYAAELDTNSCNGGVESCGIVQDYINPAINILAVLLGIVVVISIIVGGIQYSASAGDPAKAAAARKRIINALLSLVVFIFLYAIVNFLIQGGLL